MIATKACVHLKKSSPAAIADMLDAGIVISTSIATLNCSAKHVAGCFANAEHVVAVAYSTSMIAQDVKFNFDTETHLAKRRFVRGDAKVNL